MALRQAVFAALLAVAAHLAPADACLTCKCEPLPDGTCCCTHPGCPPLPPSCPPPPHNHSAGEVWRREASGAWRRAVAPALDVAIAANGSYAVSVDGALWFESDDTFITSGGTVYSLGAGTLKLEKTAKTTGMDGLGAFQQTTLVLRAGTTPPQTVEFSIKAWDDGETLEFVQSFPAGLADSNGAGDGAKNSVATSFPAWRPKTIADKPRGWMAYDGWDCDGKNGDCLMQAVAPAGHVAYGKWADDTSALPGGLEGTGPMAVFAADLTRTVVVSAFTNTMAQSQIFARDPIQPSKLPAVNISETPHSYCVGSAAAWSSPHQAGKQPAPMSFAACKAKAVELMAQGQADAFDFLEGGKVKGNLNECGDCAVCRIGMARQATPSSQNYSCFQNTNASPKGGPGVLRYGLLGSVTEIPAGWSSSVILSLGKAPGAAVRSWGKKLTSFYGKDPSLSRADFISTHLGFDTDNGAYYYYHPEPCKRGCSRVNKGECKPIPGYHAAGNQSLQGGNPPKPACVSTYEETLMDVYDYSVAVGLPYRHVQIDSWWYIKGESSGTKTWSPANGTFPPVPGGSAHSGLQRLHNATGWVYTAHNRMWAGDTTYAKQNGGDFDFTVAGGTSLPMTQDFWLWLIGDSVKWGLQMYEQDWLYTEFIGVNGTLLRSATLGRQWLMQMDRGVHHYNLGLQLCMAWPRHVLQSLEMPSVTQGRGSPDYNVKSDQGAPQTGPGTDGGHSGHQWRIGDNALFLDAIALRPTKDCFQSNQSSGELYPRLQAAVSSLSGGPVFPCDQIGTSDVALIMRSCNTDGRLLQPTRSAAPIDASILWKAGVNSGANASGEIWQADSWLDGKDAFSGLHYPQVLAAASGAYTLTMAELLDEGEEAPALGFVAVEANTSTTGAKATAVTASAPLSLPATTEATFNVWTFCPRLPSGWALLGECSTKWVPVSTQRFEDIVDDSVNGLSVRVKGPPKEVVEVSAAAPGSLTIETVACTIPQGGVAIAKFGKAGSSCVPV